MTDEGTILLNREGAVANLEINNVKKANVLTFAMLEQLAEHIEQINRDREIKAIVISGVGDRCFCGGADTTDWRPREREDFAHTWVKFGSRVFDSLARCRAPTIGVACGPTVGGGLELFACCDLRLAESHTWFALPEAGIGVVPGWSGTQRLARQLPIEALKRMAIAGTRISADEANRFGFIGQVMDKGRGLDHAVELAREIAEKPESAVQVVKVMLNAGSGEEVSSGVDLLASGYLKSGSG